MLSFQIKPRSKGNGFSLNSKLLLYPLWYPTLSGAISYANFLGRNQDYRIQIFNSKGEIIESRLITEEQMQQLREETRQKEEERQRATKAEIARFGFPTSSSGDIIGRRIKEQIKFVCVDGYTFQDDAELAFLRKIADVGGNGAINMSVRRVSNWISIQGDAVLLECF